MSLITAGEEADKLMLILVFIGEVDLALVGLGIVEIMDMVFKVALESAVNTGPLVPADTRLAVEDELRILAEGMGNENIIVTFLADAGNKMSVGAVHSDIVLTIRLIDYSYKLALVSAVFSIQVNDLQIRDVGRDRVAVFICYNALIGRRIGTTVGRNREGERIGLCAYNVEDGVILYLDPFFSAVVGNVPLIFKLGSSLRRNRNGAFIICGMIRIILTADLRIGYLGNHA